MAMAEAKVTFKGYAPSIGLVRSYDLRLWQIQRFCKYASFSSLTFVIDHSYLADEVG